MNCKPNDMAVIVRGDGPQDNNLLGLVIRVTSIDPDWHEPVWRYKGKRLYDLNGAQIVAFADRWLCPIRPDGITSSEVEALYKPTKKPEGVTA